MYIRKLRIFLDSAFLFILLAIIRMEVNVVFINLIMIKVLEDE